MLYFYSKHLVEQTMCDRRRHMKNRAHYLFLWLLGLVLAFATHPVFAGYKARPWSVRARESYPASLTSEGVTIAVEPLFTDALAGRVFDKPDMVTRGIMPLAVVIFNDNEFPIEVDGLSIELIRGNDHFRTLPPDEAVYRLFKRGTSLVFQPVPTLRKADLNVDALSDFEHKFLVDRIIGPHGKGGGFIYLHISDSKNMASYLSTASVYIPNVYRRDNGSKLIFFEIGLASAVSAGSQSGN